MPDPVKISSKALSDASIAKVEKELDLVRMRSISNLKEYAGGEGDLDPYVVLNGNDWINRSLGYSLRTDRYGELSALFACGFVPVVGFALSAWGVGAIVRSGQHWAAKAVEVGFLSVVLVATGLLALMALRALPDFVARFWKALAVSCGRLPSTARSELRATAGTGWAVSKLSIRGRGNRRLFVDDGTLNDWNLPYKDVWSVLVGRNSGLVFVVPTETGGSAQLALDTFDEAASTATVMFMKALEAGYPIRIRVGADKDDEKGAEVEAVRGLLPEGAIAEAKKDDLLTVRLPDAGFIASGAWKDVVVDFGIEYEIAMTEEELVELSQRRLMPHERLVGEIA